MDKVFIVTKADGTVLTAKNIRTFVDDGAQQLALVCRKNKLTVIAAADVASVTFGTPPAAPQTQQENP